MILLDTRPAGRGRRKAFTQEMVTLAEIVGRDLELAHVLVQVQRHGIFKHMLLVTPE